MNTYRAGAVTDDRYAARDAEGTVLVLEALVLTAPAGVVVTLGEFTAGVGYAFTVAPAADAAGTSGEIVITATGWRDVIPYQVVDTIGAALCTREQVKSRINITTTKQDATIDSLIAVVLPTVCSRYGREFMPHSTGTRIFDVRSVLVDFPECDSRSITAVVLDPNGEPVTVPASDYRARPDRLTGTITDIRLSSTITLDSAHSRKFGSAELAVTGDWGMWQTTDDVPADIQEAAVECVLSWMDRPVSEIANVDSSTPRGLMPGVAQTWDIPASAHRKFQPYNRVFGVY